MDPEFSEGGGGGGGLTVMRGRMACGSGKGAIEAFTMCS